MSLRDHLSRGTPIAGRSRGPSNTRIAALIAGLAVLLSALLGLYVMGRSVYVATDKDTLCPTAQAPSEVVVLLLDMSDQFAEPQLLQITNALDRLRNSVRPLGLIEVYAVDRLGQRVTTPPI